MGAFMDWRCRCGAKFGWFGRPEDAPPCPRCGVKPDPAEIARVEEKLEQARRKILEDFDREDT
jgi:hypothetical protein